MSRRGDGWIDPRTVTTVWDLLAARVDRTPDARFLVDQDDRELTFLDVRDRAERVAAGLAARGIRRGSVVSWQLPSAIDTVVVSLALARLGVVQNPIIPVYREREVTSLLGEVGAEMFVVPGVWNGFDFTAMAAKVADRLGRPLDVLALDTGVPEGDPATLPAPPGDGDEVRWLYSTSGTTSAPKAVRHTDATLLRASLGNAVAYDPAPDDVGSVPFPMAHIGGPLYLLMALQCGIPVVLLDAFVPDRALDVFRRHGVTMTGGSTAFYLAFLALQRAHDAESRVLPSLRQLMGGAAPMPPEVYRQVLDEVGVRCLHGYGMTECPMIATGATTDTDEQLAHTEGAPVEGCEIRVVDDEGRVVGPGEVGELRVRGSMVCKGYTDPAATAAAFDAEGWFRTGDLGLRRDDGHVVLTGRAKDMIIRKGENLSPQEIEDVLMEYPGVAAVAVIGLPDPERGERVCAVLELLPGAPAPEIAAIAAHCERAGLMRQKTPEQLEIVDTLPRNATMKILKTELRERYGS